MSRFDERNEIPDWSPLRDVAIILGGIVAVLGLPMIAAFFSML